MSDSRFLIKVDYLYEAHDTGTNIAALRERPVTTEGIDLVTKRVLLPSVLKTIATLSTDCQPGFTVTLETDFDPMTELNPGFVFHTKEFTVSYQRIPIVEVATR